MIRTSPISTKLALFYTFLFCALLLSGCAKFPDNGSVGSTKRLLFSAQVKGALRTGTEPGGTGLPYVYLVAINLSKDDVPTTQGPIPIVIPGGNGIVAGDATHFVLWNPLANPQYQIFKFRTTDLTEYFQTGVPIISTPTNVGDRELQFEIDLSQLVPAAEVNDYKSVQINFLSMNNTNTSGGGRLWDALGNSNQSSQINSPVTIRLNTPQTVNNQTTAQLEPENDTPDPDLDFIDWSVEVRIQ